MISPSYARRQDYAPMGGAVPGSAWSVDLPLPQAQPSRPAVGPAPVARYSPAPPSNPAPRPNPAAQQARADLARVESDENTLLANQRAISDLGDRLQSQLTGNSFFPNPTTATDAMNDRLTRLLQVSSAERDRLDSDLQAVSTDLNSLSGSAVSLGRRAVALARQTSANAGQLLQAGLAASNDIRSRSWFAAKRDKASVDRLLPYVLSEQQQATQAKDEFKRALERLA